MPTATLKLNRPPMKPSVIEHLVLVPQVRDYEFDQELQSNQSEAAKALKANADKKRAQLEEWSASAYGEVTCRHL